MSTDDPGTTTTEPATEEPAATPDWWHRDHPTFAALSGFYAGLLFAIVVPGLYAAILAAVVGQQRAEGLFPFVLVTLIVPLLLVIIGAVFLPEKLFLRETVMIAAAIASYFLTPKVVHEENHFGFGPIKEVAYLFAGIFITMMPALGYLEEHGSEFGLTKPAHYYFASGSLSAVLDNAPTYLNFLKLAEVSAAAAHPESFAAAAATGDEHATVATLLSVQPALVVAVSLGAVFFGAMTYIGNGPNFMVKSIAESAGVKVPTFFGYVLKFSLPILLPILALVSLLL